MDSENAPRERPVGRTGEAARAEKAQKRARGEGYPRIYDGKKYITLESVRRQLDECQRNRDDTAARLPDLIRERNRLLAAKDQNALRTWHQGAGERATRRHRSNEHNLLKEAQMLLEDFLYYQNETHRRGRAAILQRNYKPPRWNLSGQPGTYMMNEAANPPQTRIIVETFDGHQIGGPLHRQGLIDWDGRPIAEKEACPQLKLIRLNELHLWTPVCRRKPVGFGVTENDPMVPTSLQLDSDAISKECRRIEESILQDEEGLQYQTHAQRRQQELEMYPIDEPNVTTNVHRLSRMRTREGVFIAALESSYDWQTSYDSLGPVQDSIHSNFTISAERETIEEPDEKSAQDPGNSQSHDKSGEAAPEPTPSKRKSTVHRTVFSTRKKIQERRDQAQRATSPDYDRLPLPSK